MSAVIDSIDREEFKRQLAYLFALTVRNDVNLKVKLIVRSIEETLAELAGLKSAFSESPFEAITEAAPNDA